MVGRAWRWFWSLGQSFVVEETAKSSNRPVKRAPNKVDVMTVTPPGNYTILGTVTASSFTARGAERALRIKARRLGADAVVGAQVMPALGGVRYSGTAVVYTR